MFAAWKFWPLVHCITYSVIPAQHRILWVNMVDLVWNAILATISQKSEPAEAEETLSLKADLSLLEDAALPLVTAGADECLPSHEQLPHFVSVGGKETIDDEKRP